MSRIPFTFMRNLVDTTPLPTVTPTNTVTPTVTKSPGATPSVTPSITPTNTITPSITSSITPTSTVTPTVTPSGGIDPNAQAFITAAGITGTTNQNAINNLVKGLKSNNLWNKMVIVYPFIQGTATTTKYNLKDPRDTNDAFRISWSGDMVFNQSGITSNQVNGIGNTYWSPYNYNLSGQTIYNNISTGVYRLDQNLNQPGGTKLDFSFGARTNSNASLIGYFTKSDVSNVNHYFSSLNESTNCPVQVSSQTGTTGFFVSSRTGTSIYKGYKNGVQFGSTATGTVPTPPTGWFPSGTTANNTTITLLSLNQDGTQAWGSSAQLLSWFHLSTGLTDAEVSSLNNIVQTYQTALNRNI